MRTKEPLSELRFFLPVFQITFGKWQRLGWQIKAKRERNKGKINGFVMTKEDQRIRYSQTSGLVAFESPIKNSATGANDETVIGIINEWIGLEERE